MLTLPLRINTGYSRHTTAMMWFMVDGAGAFLAATDDQNRIALWQELVALTEAIADGGPVTIRTNQVSEVDLDIEVSG